VNTRRGLESSDRLYTPMPFFWLGGLHTALLSAMTVGACVLCEERFDPPETLSMLERERATLVLGWPYHGKALRDDPGFAARDLGALRAGARNAIPPTRDEIADPELRPNWLGMTEAFGPHCMSEMDRALPEAARGSFGPPLPDFEHVIVDPDTGRALDAGETGEICFRGGSLMQALYKVERQDTFDPDGFYHTGDGGRFDAQGRLFFTGRLGDTIKTAGANVSPREVELALETCPTVKEAYVVGLPDPQRGEVVAAALVAHAGAAVDAEEVRAKVRAELAAFKVPRILVPLAKDELPETATGKIRKDRLRDLLIERLER